MKFTPLGTRQLVKIYDPANVGNSWTVQNNPSQQAFKPESVRKYIRTTNRTSVISGDSEYPPSEITLNWDFMDITDLDGLRPFTAISPVVYVDNNDNGFLGIFCIDHAEQVANKTSNVWSVKSSFLVMNPYNGVGTTINQLSAPTLSAASSSTGGYIPASTTLYFWATVFTPYGESVVGPMLTYTSGTGSTNMVTLSFTANSSIYYRKTRIYWNTTNSPNSATLLTEIMSGQTASFPVYANYAQYNLEKPPTYGTAFQGYWAAGRWENDSR